SSSLVSVGSTVGVLALEGPGAVKIPQILRDLQQTAPDDKDWQNQLFSLLNAQTHNQCEVDLFELMCKVIDQSLFAQVDWARNSIFFKDLKVSFDWICAFYLAFLHFCILASFLQKSF